jgi:hypothetical protein
LQIHPKAEAAQGSDGVAGIPWNLGEHLLLLLVWLAAIVAASGGWLLHRHTEAKAAEHRERVAGVALAELEHLLLPS